LEGGEGVVACGRAVRHVIVVQVAFEALETETCPEAVPVLIACEVQRKEDAVDALHEAWRNPFPGKVHTQGTPLLRQTGRWPTKFLF